MLFRKVKTQSSIHTLLDDMKLLPLVLSVGASWVGALQFGLPLPRARHVGRLHAPMLALDEPQKSTEKASGEEQVVHIEEAAMEVKQYLEAQTADEELAKKKWLARLDADRQKSDKMRQKMKAIAEARSTASETAAFNADDTVAEVNKDDEKRIASAIDAKFSPEASQTKVDGNQAKALSDVKLMPIEVEKAEVRPTFRNEKNVADDLHIMKEAEA